jgi:uncharacterized membrane protein YczE
MTNFTMRFIRLIWGLFLYAFGIVLTINAQIGYAPWDVFHVGLSERMGFTIGIASIITGLAIGILSALMGEKLGLGTLLNMILIGTFFDLIMAVDILPITQNMFSGLLMLIAGLFVISLATYFYIGSGFGAGPRDSLMVSLTRKTGLPVGVCRALIELLIVGVGWRLGGMVGIGTIISAFMIGMLIQLTFKIMHFDSTKIEHETFMQTYRSLKITR